jgi:hypothetical protein
MLHPNLAFLEGYDGDFPENKNACHSERSEESRSSGNLRQPDGLTALGSVEIPRFARNDKTH